MNTPSITIEDSEAKFTVEILGLSAEISVELDGQPRPIHSESLADWIDGIANVTIDGNRGILCVECAVGCYLDTDDDFHVWNSDHEGARILRAIITGKDQQSCEMAGDFACEFPVATNIGVDVCQALRELVKLDA